MLKYPQDKPAHPSTIPPTNKNLLLCCAEQTQRVVHGSFHKVWFCLSTMDRERTALIAMMEDDDDGDGDLEVGDWNFSLYI